MLESTVTTFTDPCAYQDAVRSAQVEVLVTARGDFRAELTIAARQRSLALTTTMSQGRVCTAPSRG